MGWRSQWGYRAAAEAAGGSNPDPPRKPSSSDTRPNRSGSLERWPSNPVARDSRDAHAGRPRLSRAVHGGFAASQRSRRMAVEGGDAKRKMKSARGATSRCEFPPAKGYASSLIASCGAIASVRCALFSKSIARSKLLRPISLNTCLN